MLHTVRRREHERPKNVGVRRGTHLLRRRTVVAALIMMVVAGGAGLGAAEDVVRGTAFYRERIALPPDAVLEVILEDVSRADVKAEVLGRVRIENPGNPPFNFEIAYDQERIDDRYSYSVRARIVVGGELMFTTDTAYPVLTRGAGNEVELLLRNIAGRSGVAASPVGAFPASFAGDLPCADCEGIRYRLDLVSDTAYFLRTTYLGRGDAAVFDRIGSWSHSDQTRRLVLWDETGPAEQFQVVDRNTLSKLDREGQPIESALNYDIERVSGVRTLEPRLAMRGMYRIVADGGEITECQTGLRMPVVAEGDNDALEHAYLEARRRLAEEILVSLDGRMELRPLAEGGGLRRVVVVERFGDISPGETCGARMVISGLEGTRWVPTRFGDKPVVAGSGREPYLVLQAGDHRVTGFGGCNRLTGTYELAGRSLSFNQMASTTMACVDGMETEAAFTAALDRVRGYRLHSQHLELLDEAGTVVARFESRNLG